MTRKLLFLWALLITFCTSVSAQNWTWTGETWKASTKYYLRQASGDRYVTGDNKIVTDINSAALWTISGTSGATIQAIGGQKIHNEDQTWTLNGETVNGSQAYSFTTQVRVIFSTSTYYIYISSNNAINTTMSNNTASGTKNWYLISEAQKTAYDTYFSTYSALYTTAKGYNAQNSKLSDDVKSALAGVISDYASVNWKNVETAIAVLQSEKVTNAKTEIDTYDANIDAYNKAKTTAQAYVNNPLISDEINNKLTTALAVSVNGNNIEQTIADLNAAIEAAKAALDSILPYDASEKIINPDANDGTNGWTANEYATFQVAGNGSFEVASWGIANASMTQTVTGLPNGYYVLQASQMAPVGNTVELWGNNSSNTYTATTQEFRDLGVVCLVTDGTLTIKAVNNNEGAWSNFDHFTLKYYGTEEPDLTYYVGEKIDGTYLNQQPVYTGADESKTALLVVSYVDPYTNDPKTPYGIRSGAKATVKNSKGTVEEVELKEDPTPYNENSFAIFIENFDETETYEITIPAGSFGYIDKPGNSTNEQIYLEAVQSPLHDGKYFVVVKGTGKHVSRGKGWGTQAILDYYGVPMTVQTSGQTIFRFLDSNAFMGSGPNDDWMYTDKRVSEVKEIRRYILVPGTGEHEGEYMFYNPIRKKYLYYATPDGESYDAVFEGDEGAWFQFEVLDAAGYAAHLAKIEEDEAIRVAARAGFVVSTKSEYDALIEKWESEDFTTIFPSNSTEQALTEKYFEKKNADLACDVDWAGTPRDLVGGEKVKLTLDKGLYVMHCDAFQQAMNLATLKANQGFRGLTYMYVKVGNEMYKSQLKSITETTGTIPTDEASAIAALDSEDETFANKVIFYVPADGTQVEFGVENPQRLGNGVDETAGSWVAFKNIKIEKFNAELDEANLKCDIDKYGTFVAPFNVILPDGIIAMKATQEQNDKVIATKIELGENNILPAGTPVIVKNISNENINETYIQVKTKKDDTVTYGTLTGALVAGQEVPTGSFVLQTQQDLQAFYIVVKDKPFICTKNRCYVKTEDNTPNNPQAKVINIVENDDATGIVEVEKTNNKPETAVIYDLSGRRVNVAQKGIYIINGKKVVK